MWSKQFWLDAGERAIRTFVQAVIALWAATAVTGLADIDWAIAGSVGGFAALLSLAMSLVGGSVHTTGSPSFIPEVGEPVEDGEFRG